MKHDLKHLAKVEKAWNINVNNKPEAIIKHIWKNSFTSTPSPSRISKAKNRRFHRVSVHRH
jgi:hypothetical protein